MDGPDLVEGGLLTIDGSDVAEGRLLDWEVLDGAVTADVVALLVCGYLETLELMAVDVENVDVGDDVWSFPWVPDVVVGLGESELLLPPPCKQEESSEGATDTKVV